MRLEMGSLIDVADHENLIRQEAWTRYQRAQTNRDENNHNKGAARSRHLRGVAAEVAARVQLGIDPYGVLDDAIGQPDIIHNGITYDVKSVTLEKPLLSVKYYDGVLERRNDWVIMVMQYEGIGWRFRHLADIQYKSLQHLDTKPGYNHTSRYWQIDLGPKENDTR